MSIPSVGRRGAGFAVIGFATLLALSAVGAGLSGAAAPGFGTAQQVALMAATAIAVVGVWLLTESWEATLAAAIVGAMVISRVPTLDQPLQEAHGFRQTQTAYTALTFSREGLDLLHPGPPALGPPFQVPMEFPLFQALAVIPLELDLPADVALRLTGLICFVVTALLLYGLLRKVAGVAVAVAGLIAFVASPFALLWSRTSMIEYLATAGAVGMVWTLILWRERRRPELAAAALAAGSVGMLVKPTTAAFYYLPALAWRTPDAATAREWLRSLLNPTLVAIVAIPFALTLLWTHHADAIKSAHEVTDVLTSESLQDWNFGTWDQRSSLANWGTIWERVADWILGPALILLPFSAVAAWRSGQRTFWLTVAAAFILPPAIFFNLHLAHDYYQAAITPAAAALLGLGAGWLWERIGSPRGRLAAATAGAVLVAATVAIGNGYWRAQDRVEAGAAFAFAKPLKRATDPDELALVVGLHGWSPDVLYYARRRGLTLERGFVRPGFMARQRDRYHVLVSANPTLDSLPVVFSAWRWIGVLGRRLYAMGEQPGQIAGSAVSASEDSEALAAAAERGRVLSSTARRIRCNTASPTVVPDGERGTWLRVRAGPDALLAIGDLPLSPIPARSAVAIAPQKGSKVTVFCFGEPRIKVTEIIDAPPPVGCAKPRPLRWPGCHDPLRRAG